MTPLWTTNVGSPLRGLALARERGWLLAWDQRQQLYLYERGGSCRSMHAAPAAVAAACMADDGTSLAAVGTSGEVWLLGPDFQSCREIKMPQGGLAVACDPFGRFFAVSDVKGNVLLFDRQGRQLGQTKVPRPLRHLAFIPERPNFVGAADFGLVACFGDRAECVWRDGLVANVGSLAVSGNGQTIALSGFSQGLYCYRLDGPPHRWLPLPALCCLAALRHDGKVILLANDKSELLLVDLEQKVRAREQGLKAPVVALTLSPLGDFAGVALADGTLLAMDLP